MYLLQKKIENETLIFAISGRVDSTNAEELNKEIMSALSEASYSAVAIDAEKLEYVSSAGLRVLLAMRKKAGELRIFNVSAGLYDILEMTGFTEMMKVEKALRTLSVDGCKIIGKGAKATVYRHDPDTIVKVYKDADSLPEIKKERSMARWAFVAGVPTAIAYEVVRIGEQYGTVFELLESKTVSQMIVEDPANKADYIRQFALLLRRIHETKADTDVIPNVKETAIKWFDVAKDCFASEEAAVLKRYIAEVPDTGTLLHCDYHSNNVMQRGSEMLLVDMATLSHGHPIFELANIFVTYVGFGELTPTVVESFLGLPYDLAKEIWLQFLKDYLGTEDHKRLLEVEQKAKLLGYVRILHHTVRRGGTGTTDGQNTIAHCVREITQLLSKVKTLDF